MSERDYVTTAALVWSAVHELAVEYVSQCIYIKAVSPGEALRIADAIAKVLRVEHVHDVDNDWWKLPDANVTVWYDKPEVAS